MSTWRRKLLDEFPEFGGEPEKWETVDASSALSALLVTAARAGDTATVRRALNYVLWAERQSAGDEQFAHFCVSALRSVFESPSTRPVLVGLLNGGSFAQLRGTIEWMSSPSVLKQVEEQVRLQTRGLR